MPLRRWARAGAAAAWALAAAASPSPAAADRAPAGLAAAQAQYALGVRGYFGLGAAVDRDRAMRWHGLAAARGHVLAQRFLRIMPAGTGAGAPVAAPARSSRLARALDRRRQAARQGDADPQYDLGLLYYRGEETARNWPRALRWFRLAAAQGEADAQHRLGGMYARGQGGRADLTQAVAWFHRAAQQGHEEAQLALGAMYHLGFGVAENDRRSRRWLSFAAVQGHREAADFLRVLGEESAAPTAHAPAAGAPAARRHVSERPARAARSAPGRAGIPAAGRPVSERAARSAPGRAGIPAAGRHVPERAARRAPGRFERAPAAPAADEFRAAARATNPAPAEVEVYALGGEPAAQASDSGWLGWLDHPLARRWLRALSEVDATLVDRLIFAALLAMLIAVALWGRRDEEPSDGAAARDG